MPVWWEYVRDLLSMREHAHDHLPDLRDLESDRVQVQGTHFVVHDTQREVDGDRRYILRREPRNRRNPSAIAVYARGRGVGYVDHDRAVALAPLLDSLGGAAIVNGLGSTPGSMRLWVHLPTTDALAAYVRADAAV